MQNFLEILEKGLLDDPNKPITFPLDSDNPQSMSFIKSLDNNKEFIEKYSKIGKIIFMPYGKNVEKFICGIAPIWKKYDSRNDFEGHYKLSELMRTVYCNEREDDGSLVSIFVEINNEKFIVTWECKNDVDNFHYHKATPEERGLLDMLWFIFGGATKKENNDEIRQLNPKVGVLFETNITQNYGVELGVIKKIYEHTRQLGYSVDGNASLVIG